MKARILGVGLGLVVTLVVHAGPQTITVQSGAFRTPMLELYTSEGCSSCPPADAWLRELGEVLGEELHAVPLAFHVDYWDYLGWTDPYAKPRYSKRQRAIPANYRRTIYTPQFVADGRSARRVNAVLRAIVDANAQPSQADIWVRVRRDSADLQLLNTRVRVQNRTQARRVHAHLVVYENAIIRSIGAGENRGRTIQYDFVVRHFSHPRRITRGDNDLAMKVRMGSDWARPNLGLAIVVVDAQSGKTLQAVRTPIAELFGAAN